MSRATPIQIRHSMETRLREYELAEELANVHLGKFDDLDFNVFSNQEWVRLHESHAANVIVHWPDGRLTQGINKHIEDMKAMFAYAPDTRIKVHPIRIAAGEWTSVVGENGGDVHVADADAGRQQHCAHRQGLQDPDVHGRALERGRHGRGISVLGQSFLHATDRHRLTEVPRAAAERGPLRRCLTSGLCPALPVASALLMVPGGRSR